LIAAGCDAGVRYEERLKQDMIAVPIGPRMQLFAAAPAHLDRGPLVPILKPWWQGCCQSMSRVGRPSGELAFYSTPLLVRGARE
jgi:hypothetical protein